MKQKRTPWPLIWGRVLRGHPPDGLVPIYPAFAANPHPILLVPRNLMKPLLKWGYLRITERLFYLEPSTFTEVLSLPGVKKEQ